MTDDHAPDDDPAFAGALVLAAIIFPEDGIKALREKAGNCVGHMRSMERSKVWMDGPGAPAMDEPQESEK